MGELKDLFVSYEIARQVKEKGFDESCFAVYGKSEEHGLQLAPRSFDFLDTIDDKHFIKAPTHQQVIDWLRYKHGLYIYSLPMIDKTELPWIMCFLPTIHKISDLFDDGFTADDVVYDNYEALDKAIEQALKLI